MKKNYPGLIFVSDFFLIIISYVLAIWLRFDGQPPQNVVSGLVILLPVIISCQLLCSFILGCYDGVFMFAGFPELFRQMGSVTLCTGFLLFVKYAALPKISGSIIIIYAITVFVFTCGLRGFARFLAYIESRMYTNRKELKRLMVIGAGAAGAMIIKRLKDCPGDGYLPVGILDDDRDKQGFRVGGVPVLGSIDEVCKYCEKYRVDEILIAIPSADTDVIRQLYTRCMPSNLPVKMFQSVVDAQDAMPTDIPAIKEVSIEELLFRDAVNADLSTAKSFIKDKVVIVTGGAGSIGSELCRQILTFECKHLVIFDIHENGLFELNEEFKNKFSTQKYSLVLGSVRDERRLDEVFAKFRPEVAFHAAAHKHVPMMEINPFEAVKNNVVGTHNVILACKKYLVSKFILISTDKAVNPTNIMGATKRIAELLVKSESDGKCELAAVRFGNVLGSNGSVIPIFKRQIKEGGPVTVTDPEMRRYFMTIPEASSLVLTAGAKAHKGELFVLDMGKPVKIYDLACDLIRLSGFRPNENMKIVFTGLRPGEKLFEELSLDYEQVDATSHKKIFVMRESNFNKVGFLQKLAEIKKYALENKEYDENTLATLVFDAIEIKKPVLLKKVD